VDIEEAVASVARETPAIVSVYLFGSFAEGREHQESDVDLGVLLDWKLTPDERFDLRLRLIGEWSTYERDADVVILNEAPPLFARAILYRGRRIYGSDPAADHAFVRDTQLLAADIEPWMKRMWAIKLEALLRR
jgi:predicted nucleotidyltransferase